MNHKATTTLKIAACSVEAAKFACKNYHYSHCVPRSKAYKLGVYEDNEYKGVVIFSRGANNNMGKEFNLSCTEVVELTRIALKDHDHFVSEIMIQCIKVLKENNPGIRLIYSYADPEQRHIGAIYQATNWVYLGRTKGNTFYLLDGKPIHPRTMSCERDRDNRTDITRDEYFIQKYGDRGRIVKDTGKFKYVFPLDKEMKKIVSKYGKPYPKKDDI